MILSWLRGAVAALRGSACPQCSALYMKIRHTYSSYQQHYITGHWQCCRSQILHEPFDDEAEVREILQRPFSPSPDARAALASHALSPRQSAPLAARCECGAIVHNDVHSGRAGSPAQGAPVIRQKVSFLARGGSLSPSCSPERFAGGSTIAAEHGHAQCSPARGTVGARAPAAEPSPRPWPFKFPTPYSPSAAKVPGGVSPSRLRSCSPPPRTSTSKAADAAPSSPASQQRATGSRAAGQDTSVAMCRKCQQAAARDSAGRQLLAAMQVPAAAWGARSGAPERQAAQHFVSRVQAVPQR